MHDGYGNMRGRHGNMHGSHGNPPGGLEQDAEGGRFGVSYVVDSADKQGSETPPLSIATPLLETEERVGSLDNPREGRGMCECECVCVRG